MIAYSDRNARKLVINHKRARMAKTGEKMDYKAQ